MEDLTPKTEAFLKLRNAIPERMDEVFQIIKKLQPCTYTEVADQIETPLNRVTGRVSDLLNVGLIYRSGTINDSGNRQSLFSVCEPERAEKIQRELYRKFRTQKDECESDLAKIPNLNETTEKLIKQKISYCYGKLRMLNRYRVKNKKTGE